MRKPVPFLLSLLLPYLASAQTEWIQRDPGAVIEGGLSVITGRPGLLLVQNPDDEIDSWLRSTDGAQWTKTKLAFAQCAHTAGGRTVGAAEGEFGDDYVLRIWYTDDGLTVKTGHVAASDHCKSLAFGGGVWVLVTHGGDIYFSKDNAVSWKSAISPAARLEKIVYGGGYFLATDESSLIRSTDGENWAVMPSSPSAPARHFDYFDGYFYTDKRRSSDGSIWPDFPISLGSNLVAGNVLLSWRDTRFYSIFGGAWDIISDVPLTGDGIISATFCGDKWLAVSQSKIFTSAVPALPPPVAPPLTIAPAVSLSWPTVQGRAYQIQRSPDNAAWTNEGGLIYGDGSTRTWYAPAGAGSAFFRVQAK